MQACLGPNVENERNIVELIKIIKNLLGFVHCKWAARQHQRERFTVQQQVTASAVFRAATKTFVFVRFQTAR